MSAVGGAVRFIRVNGKVIPIRAPTGAGGKVAARAITKGATKAAASPTLHKIANHLSKQKSIKPNFMLKYGSEALSVAEGAASGLLPMNAKGLVAGVGVHVAGEVAVGGLGAAAYAGKGHKALRLKAIAKQEATNQALGWGAFAATSLGTKAGRAAAAGAAEKILSFARKTLGVVE